MDLIHVTINIIWPVIGLVLLPMAGYVTGSLQHRRLQNKVMRLESEMLQNHRQILLLLQQLAQLQKTGGAPVNSAAQVLFLEKSKNNNSDLSSAAL